MGEICFGDIRINLRSLNSEGEKNDLVSAYKKWTGKGREERAGEAETGVLAVVSRRDSWDLGQALAEVGEG